MKRMIWMTIVTLLVLGMNVASAQSLGDVARSARKGKTHQSTANHTYDNDNLPKQDHLSVVGPAPAAAASADGTDPQAQAAQQPKPDPKAAADEWKTKIDDQQQKVDSLSRELDLTQREYKLRAAVMYSDAGNRLRNAAAWDKEDSDYKEQIEEKQKALDAARQDLSDVKEQARKAGVPAGKE